MVNGKGRNDDEEKGDGLIYEMSSSASRESRAPASRNPSSRTVITSKQKRTERENETP